MMLRKRGKKFYVTKMILLGFCLHWQKIFSHWKKSIKIVFFLTAKNLILNGCPRGVMVKTAKPRNRSKRVWTTVTLLRSLSEKYPQERHEPLYPPRYGLNSPNTALLGGWIWHWKTQEGWYAIKQLTPPPKKKRSYSRIGLFNHWICMRALLLLFEKKICAKFARVQFYCTFITEVDSIMVVCVLTCCA